MGIPDWRLVRDYRRAAVQSHANAVDRCALAHGPAAARAA
jgi:hypothetical protein